VGSNGGMGEKKISALPENGITVVESLYWMSCPGNVTDNILILITVRLDVKNIPLEIPSTLFLSTCQ
jgi:hypothetical protein